MFPVFISFAVFGLFHKKDAIPHVLIYHKILRRNYFDSDYSFYRFLSFYFTTIGWEKCVMISVVTDKKRKEIRNSTNDCCKQFLTLMLKLQYDGELLLYLLDFSKIVINTQW